VSVLKCQPSFRIRFTCSVRPQGFDSSVLRIQIFCDVSGLIVSPCFKEMQCHHLQRSRSPENLFYTLPDPDMKAVQSFNMSRNTNLGQWHISKDQNPHGTYILNKMAKYNGGVAAQNAQTVSETQQSRDLFNQQDQQILVQLQMILK